jgi:leucine dehydrogenase
MIIRYWQAARQAYLKGLQIREPIITSDYRKEAASMKAKGIFDFMGEKGLTSLEIFYSRRLDEFLMRGMKEWDENLDFSAYARDFTYLDILTEHYRGIGTKELAADLEELGLGEYLGRVEQLMTQGRHEGIEFYYHGARNIRAAFCKHSVTLGRNNRFHAIRAGAMRRHELHEPELDVITDGLNLSRAMSYKNAVAAIPFGGCKTVVQCAPVKLDDYETIGFLSYVADRTRNFPGADMGLEEAMVDVIHERFTRNFVGGAKSPLVSTGTPTAYGELCAIKEACGFLSGSSDLSGKTVAVQGLGHVGFPLAEYLLKEGARLIVSDIEKAKVQQLEQRYGTERVKEAPPDEIYTVDADVFAPSAMGGIITEDRIPRFKFKIILGSANNQLKATSQEQEIELAEKVADAGILFVVDWAHNTGGVIAAALLWQLQDEADEEQLRPRIELACRTNFRKLLEQSRQTGKTATELVYEKVEKMVYGG